MRRSDLPGDDRPASAPLNLFGTDVPFAQILGNSRETRRAVSTARRIAREGDQPVLILGAAGTGKELFARGIHYAGARPGSPFMAVNCTAVPEQLLEAELFGRAPDSSPAHVEERGLLEIAGRGTVFLDDIADLPARLQRRLLGVLATRSVRRYPGAAPSPVECRIVASTTQDLEGAVAAGRFLPELHERLNTSIIELPTLTARGAEDIALLARHFAAVVCTELGLPAKQITPQAMHELQRYDWPGNVRELKGVIERAVGLAEGDEIDVRHLVIQQRSQVPVAATGARRRAAGTIRVPSVGLTLEDAERQLVSMTLRLANMNQSRAARMLGISRPTLIRKVRKYRIRASGKGRG